MLILITGPQGAGKTYIGRGLESTYLIQDLRCIRHDGERQITARLLQHDLNIADRVIVEAQVESYAAALELIRRFPAPVDHHIHVGYPSEIGQTA